MEQWPLLEADLQDAGVDVGDDALMESRSWRWFAARVEGVFAKPPVGFVKVYAQDGHSYHQQPVYATRLQHHFFAHSPEG